MKAEVWLKIQGKKTYGRWSVGPVSCSKSKPCTLDKEVAIKLTIEIPDEVFEEPVYEAKVEMPKVTRKLPETVEIARGVGEALSQQLGFKVNVSMSEPVEG